MSNKRTRRQTQRPGASYAGEQSAVSVPVVVLSDLPVQVPVPMRGLNRRQSEAVVRLARLTQQLHEFEEEQAAQVEALHDSGLAWSGIGWAVGTSGEAARQRFHVRKLNKSAP